MKKLFTNTIMMLLLISAAFLLFYFSGSLFLRKNIDLKLSDDIKYGVFGHSHPETAFNDSIIQGLKNFASSGESYFYTYNKILRIVEQNENIKTIFVEFTNNHISAIMDDWTWDKMHLDNKYLEINPLINLSDQLVLLRNNPGEFSSKFLLANKRNVERILGKDFKYSDKSLFGGYNKIKISKIDSLIRIYNPVRPREYDEDYKLSETNLRYLEKIIQLCEKEGIKFFLIRSPLHDNFQGFLYENNYLKELNDRFGDIDFIDLSRYPLDDDEFVDLEHLNDRGAKKFSQWFDSMLNEKLVFSGDSVASKIEKELDLLGSEEAFKLIPRLKEILESNEMPEFNRIIENGSFAKFSCEFSPGISSNAIYLTSDKDFRYALLHLTSEPEPKEFDEVSFGIHLGIYLKDFDKRPNWLKKKNSDRLAFKVAPDFFRVKGENFVILKFKKQSDIDEFEYLRLFLQDRDNYRGVIGNPKRIDNIEFKRMIY